MYPPTLSAFDISEIIITALSKYWWAILVILLLKIWRLPSLKGWFGEKAVDRALKRLPTDSYTIYHDIYLPRPDGKGTTQIDHLAVSRFGIFVIETKNYQGWIFGSERQRNWTQSIYKKKYKFQNPLHQNKLHINALAALLELNTNKFHNLIYFVGECTLKTELPPNVMTSGILKYIHSQHSPLLSEQELSHSLRTLNSHIQSYDKRQVAKQHKMSLRSNVEC
ncbi:nuclease-related domain-containing protein [Rubritalea tangerina]|uniref:Nuclease-related domain-containing protein n=1 Tax=Rubritalea tangerina TaxID=430798 RepID=A0ABW4ZFP7_9BACT